MVPAFAVLLVAACQGEAPGIVVDLGDDRAPGWTEGRRFEVRVLGDSGAVERQASSIEVESPEFLDLSGRLESQCARFAAERFSDLRGEASHCGQRHAREQLIQLCQANTWLQLAQSVSYTDVDEEGMVSQRGLEEEAPPRTRYTFAPPSRSDVASLALLAAERFREAGRRAQAALDLERCADGALGMTVPGGAEDGSGLSSNERHRVSVGHVIAIQTNETLLGLEDAEQVARNAIAADAQSRRAAELDEAVAVRNMWRGRHSSRLESANVLVGAPARAFEPSSRDDGEGRGELPLPAGCSITEEDRRAEALLRRLRVDPRVSQARLLEDVVAALREESPETFDHLEGTSGETLAELGIEPTRISAAARRISAETIVRGRPIVVVDGTRASGVVRVNGTQAAFAPTTPAIHMLRTAGARFSDDVDARSHRPSSSYANRSVAGALDSLATSIEAAMRRADLERDAVRLMRSGFTAVRERVNMRFRAELGQPTAAGTIDQSRLRLYGAKPGHQYGLWLGEEGVLCATTGSIYGQRCDARNYRVDTEPTVHTDGADSGLGDHYLQWDVVDMPMSTRTPAASADMDVARRLGALETARLSGGLFLVDETPAGTGVGVALAGIDTTVHSTRAGGVSRSIDVPLGEVLLGELGDIMDFSSVSCANPRFTCSGLPDDLRIPLEDELIGDRDDVESSFRHYISQAQRAALQADNLGERLITQGMALDERAEGAREELERICGGVVNLASLLPDNCASNADCPVDVACVAGTCAFESVEQLLAVESPDLDSVRRCLAAPGSEELVSAALGDTRICLWQFGGAPTCVCPEGEACPEDCGRLRGASEAECRAVFEEQSGPIHPELTVFASEILNLSTVAPTEPTAPADCLTLAALQLGLGEGGYQSNIESTSTPLSVLDQPWADLHSVSNAARSLGFEADLYATGGITRNARMWRPVATLSSGPVSGWPCGYWIPEADPDALPYVANEDLDPQARRLRHLCEVTDRVGARSILCGMDCDSSEERSQALRRLYRASLALSELTDERHSGVHTPMLRFDGDVVVEGLGPDIIVSGNSEIDDSINSELGPLLGLHGNAYLSCASSAFVAHDPFISGEVGRLSPYAHDLLLPDFAYGRPVTVELPAETARCLRIDSGDSPSPELCGLVHGAVCPNTLSSREVVLPPDPLSVLADLWGPEEAGYFYPNGQLPALHSNLRQGLRAYHSGDIEPQPLLFAGDGGSFPQALPGETVLDALQLACIAQTQPGGGCLHSASVPETQTPDDFRQISDRLDCAADDLRSSISSMMVTDVPAQVARDVAEQNVSPTFPSYRGEYGATVARLRATLEGLASDAGQIERVLRALARAIDTAREQLTLLGLQSEIGDWSLLSKVSSQTARCGAAVSRAASLDFVGGAAGAAAFECADSVMQIITAVSIDSLQDEISGIEERQALGRLGDAFAQQQASLQDAASSISTRFAQINGILASLESLRSSARRAVSRILMLDVDAEVDREYRTNRVMRGRYSEIGRRYENARMNAIRRAWIARRGLEQRLGVDLATIEEEWGGVPAPATWVDGLCSLGGIDYEDLASGENNLEQGTGNPCLTGYVGDYVDCLENTLEEYRFRYPFQNNDNDVAMVSLRDDVFRSRAVCEVDVPNLLSWSVDVGGPDGRTRWTSECGRGNQDACIVQLATGLTPFVTSVSESGELRERTGSAAARHMHFSQPVDGVGDVTAEGPWWSQTLELGAGDYTLTWYEVTAPSLAAGGGRACPNPATPPAPSGASLTNTVVGFTSAAPLSIDMPSAPYLAPCSDPSMSAGWQRASIHFSNPETQEVTIRFRPRSLAPDVGVVWAAPQLVRGASSGTPYYATAAAGQWPYAVCEDADGDAFRSFGNWAYGCESVCPEGLGSGCTGHLSRCFHETRFNINLSDIERGGLLSTGSFAHGNFNYRYNDIGVNLVGVGIRDCEGVDRPAACYASGFVPYSIRHDGPFHVRNHLGDTYEAPLFSGNIEHGKALAAERYLTNPLSSSDRALMADYWHREFRGRPLDGSYRIRIYDTPGLRWENIEDVQLAVRYRYWTRFE